MKSIRVCLATATVVFTSLCLSFMYLNQAVLNNLSVEHDTIPSLDSDQITLYTLVSEEFVKEVHHPNRAYIKNIYKSDEGEIIVHIEYFNENFSLVYVNGRILKGYTIRDQPMLPCYYVFNEKGRFLRKSTGIVEE